MQLYTSLTSIEPLSWTYCSMRTLVEESIRKGRVLVDNVAHERFEFCVDNLAIATVCRCRTPVEVILTWFDPFRQRFTSFFF